MLKPYCFCTKKKKKSNKLERICKHESSSKSVVVASIHVSLQFSGKAALKTRVMLSYRASEASEQKIHFVPFSTKITLIVGLIVKFYKPFSQ